MTPTQRQSEVLAFLRTYIAANGYAPSLEEIGKHLGDKSKGNVHRMLGCLEERGAIRRIPNRNRAIEIIEPDGGVEASLQQAYIALRSLPEGKKRSELGGLIIKALLVWKDAS